MAKRKQTAGERIADSLRMIDVMEPEMVARRIDRAIREAERRGYERAKREERDRRDLIASDELDAAGEAAAYDY